MGVLSTDGTCSDVESHAHRHAIGFQDLDKTKVVVAGGKGANLGELSRIDGIRVPDGFCITTEAFERIMRETSSIDELLDRLSLVKADDRDGIKELSGEIRRLIEGIAIPGDIEEEIVRLLSSLGEDDAYAIRSSATAEDLPTASFAGQQDTYLNVIGKAVDPAARQQVLGIAVHRAGGDLSHSKRLRPPQGPAWPWWCRR